MPSHVEMMKVPGETLYCIIYAPNLRISLIYYFFVPRSLVFIVTQFHTTDLRPIKAPFQIKFQTNTALFIHLYWGDALWRLQGVAARGDAEQGSTLGETPSEVTLQWPLRSTVSLNCHWNWVLSRSSSWTKTMTLSLLCSGWVYFMYVCVWMAK